MSIGEWKNKTSLEDRLLLGINRRNLDGCWLWIGAVNRRGYGVIHIYGRGVVPVHRLAYETFIGPIPRNDTVAQTCGNKQCIRTTHLVLRSALPKEAKDWNRKGQPHRRHNLGEKNSQAKLTTAQVIEIKRSLADGVSVRTLATNYSVAYSLILDIKLGNSWAHVAMPDDC